MNDEHERLRALVTKVVEGVAGAAERVEVESHLASCPECRAASESELELREAMIRETRAFSEGFDAGRLEANLKSELRSGANRIRWVAMLGVLFGLLTVVLYGRPPASQPESWTATLPLTGGLLFALVMTLRKQARIVAIARAAEATRSGYRALEGARVQVDVRELRMSAWLGLAAAFAVPMVIGLGGILLQARQQHALPGAVVKVNFSGALVNTLVVAGFLILGSLLCLWQARRLERTYDESRRQVDAHP